MSPLGLKVLTGAGLSEDADVKHVHATYDVALDAAGKGKITLSRMLEEGFSTENGKLEFCNDTELKPYATVLDHNGAIVDWVDSANITVAGTAGSVPNTFDIAKKDLEVTVAGLSNVTIKLDFYVRMTSGATQISIKPDDFGGYFYVEADTLYRNQDGKDMAATLTFPKVKIQSGFTLAMAPSGDPSTFDFTMDALPGYTYFDQSRKVVVDMTIVSGSTEAEEDSAKHSTPVSHVASVEVDG